MPDSATLSDEIWARMQVNDYAGARSILEREIVHSGDDHWLLTRLATTFHEERRYEDALAVELRAYAIAPRCPLVLWDLAGTHQMLGDHEAALRIYGRLISRGVTEIAHDECGEGVGWARGLVADAHYRRAQSLHAAGRPRAARNAVDRHLEMRGPGCHSIYSLAKVNADRERY